jgi:ATP-binding cassette subfamily C (CFTR/MRP) protein 1
VRRLNYGDHIIALDSTGHIAEQGSFSHLRNARGYIQSLTTRAKSQDEDITQVPIEETGAKPLALEAEEIELAEEDLNRQTGDFAVYKYYLGSIGWLTSVFFLGLCILFGVSNKMTEFLLTYWTRDVVVYGNSVNAFYLGLYGLLTGLAVAGITGSVAQLALKMVPKSAEILHSRLLSTVMGAPLVFFTKTDTGAITNR